MPFTTSKDGTKIAYEKSGQGPSLILIGGAFSHRKFNGLVKLADILADHFTVYNYDRRGRGDSDDQPPYSITKEIEDLNAVIATSDNPVFVWGLSSGAVLALEAAEQGSNINKLVLHEPPFVVTPSDQTAPTDFTKHVIQLIAEDKRADAIKYFMTKGMGAPGFIVTMMRFMPRVWQDLINVAHTLPYDATLLDGYMEGKPLSQEPWKNVCMPTLVLVGTESPASLRRGAKALTDVLAPATLTSKKGLGHTKKLNEQLIATELIAFFTN
ncbi:Pimeloyl-ACP methyl ester carboxylesterase [Amphibacillus marinus]|uniref:Pimeloyl-ACP methyl ester carboxylesterase n=1 Tax=Amphibacillus marinus TaxID=872970 RepID=A0A1H8RI09_9BACI|nr:alpha/beta hydrolase [Amphibacillus marinus]SEO65986.1 Pimeloyl-ACP methyl ester carboxylesterase [Amphibacillus marinus]